MVCAKRSAEIAFLNLSAGAAVETGGNDLGQKGFRSGYPAFL